MRRTFEKSTWANAKLDQRLTRQTEPNARDVAIPALGQRRTVRQVSPVRCLYSDDAATPKVRVRRFVCDEFPRKAFSRNAYVLRVRNHHNKQ